MGRLKKKYCITCKEELFNRKKNALYCKKCYNERKAESARKWRENNREKVNNYAKEYYRKRKEVK